MAISVVVPVFNEEESLGELRRRLCDVRDSNTQEEFEFLMVNDGSTDRSRQILDNIANDEKDFRIVHFARNCGHQVAISAGLDYSRGDEVIVMDADLQDPPELIMSIVEKIRKGHDVVHMQRQSRKGESWLKLSTARIFYWLLFRLSSTAVVENCGDFRGVSRRALDVVLSFREPHKFFRAAFAHAGFNQHVMKYDRDPRYAGVTKYSFLKLCQLASNAVMSFTAAPLNFVFSTSLALWGLAVLFGMKALYGRFVLQHPTSGWTSVVLLMIFLTGVVLFSLAIVGSYIRRIFEQGQDRPLYWISETRNLNLNEFSKWKEQKLSRTVGNVGPNMRIDGGVSEDSEAISELAATVD